MSKSTLKKLNKPSKFTRKLLAEVTDERYDDAIYVLTHSYAARETFARLQYELHFDEFAEEFAYSKALEAISCEVAHRAHGKRRTGVSSGTFRRLAEELDVPSEHDEWGESHVRTIVGWWTV